MTNQKFTICVAAYDDHDLVRADWNRLRDAEKDGLSLRDAAMVERADDGELSVAHDLHHPVSKGVLAGLVVAAFTPVGLIGGVLAGAIGGKLTEHLTREVTRSDFRDLGRYLGTAPWLIVAISPGETQDALKATLADAVDIATAASTTDEALFKQVLTRYEGLGPSTSPP